MHAGASIMEEGDAGDCMYILLSGSVEVRQQQVPEGLDLDTDYCENSSLVSGFTYNTKATKRTRVSALAPASGMGRSNPSGVRSGEKDHHFESAVEKHAIISVMDEEADKAGMVKHDGNYWVNK